MTDRPRIHFVTGRLAEHALRQVLDRLGPRAGFEHTVQVLNTLKHKLNNLTTESELLKRETTARKESLAKISEEITRVEQEKEQAARLDRKLRREENTESNMPQVLEYVQQKAEAFVLESQLNAWKRKVGIAEMENRRLQSLARKAGLR